MERKLCLFLSAGHRKALSSGGSEVAVQRAGVEAFRRRESCSSRTSHCTEALLRVMLQQPDRSNSFPGPPLASLRWLHIDVIGSLTLVGFYATTVLACCSTNRARHTAEFTVVFTPLLLILLLFYVHRAVAEKCLSNI
ncbi:hypothetical protein CRENBAI_019109 [Crenichthys baileyi]|uniref:Uncharacterized protein n=1 Tax=Crenichthys baileyi TaxID=28760 RepID=A0AAV9QUF2_9TELE